MQSYIAAAKLVEKDYLFTEIASKPRCRMLKKKLIKLWEGNSNRKDWRSDRAATKIQAAFRGHLARNGMEKCRDEYLKVGYIDFRCKLIQKEILKVEEQCKELDKVLLKLNHDL